MTKEEVALQLTITLAPRMISPFGSNYDNTEEINIKNAKLVSSFYNAIFNDLDITE